MADYGSADYGLAGGGLVAGGSVACGSVDYGLAGGGVAAGGSVTGEEVVVPCKQKSHNCDIIFSPETNHSLEGTKKSGVSAESCPIQEILDNMCKKRVPHKGSQLRGNTSACACPTRVAEKAGGRRSQASKKTDEGS